MRRRTAVRGLAAVLFTDIVDSSAIGSRLGNARWKELIARHHAAVRRELRRFGGRELDTAGDGFFASFDDPGSAIRCACAAVDAVRELGIEIRSGVHFGAVEESGDKLAGITVVVGARVMALGGAGDVLVTASTGELVAGGGFGFDDRGDHILKGLDSTWHVLAVTAVDGTPRMAPADPTEAERRLTVIQPSPLGGSRRRPWLIVTALLVVTAMVALIVALRPGETAIDIGADSLGWIDAASGDLDGVMAIGSRPGAMAIGFGSAWVAAPDRGIVVRVDGATGTISDTIRVGTQPSGIVVAEGAVWVSNAADGTVSRIDPATNEESQIIEAGAGPTGIAAGEGALWVADTVGSTLIRLDPSTGTRQMVPLSGQPSGVAVAPDGGVWVTVAPAGVARVDPEDPRVTLTQAVGNGPSAVTSASGSIWVTNQLDGTVTRLDPVTGVVRAVIRVGDGPNAIVGAAERVWVANEAGDSLTVIDPTTNTRDRTTSIGTTAVSLAADGDMLWLAAGASATEHVGGTLRIASPLQPNTLDPAVSYDAAVWRILAVTNDGLVTYKKVGGPDGATIVPDLAVALPQISDDGLDYRFTLRDGIRYSTGEPVRAEDVRHSLERSLSLHEVAATAFSALHGTRACSRDPDMCDLSRSVEIDANVITIHLSHPDPDLLYKLSSTWASVLPSTLPREDQGLVPLPATGPYMVTQAGPGAIELERNPEFREFSSAAQPDGFVDAISWRTGEPGGASYERLVQGELELMDEPDPADLASLLAEHPDQVVSSPDPTTMYIGFDVRQVPFDDPQVRQAVNLAIDRERVIELLGGPTLQRLTCQILPPSLAGYEPFCPSTQDPGAGEWSAPDMERARELIDAAGAAGHPVRVSVTDAPDIPPGWATTMRYVTRVLDGLGLEARLTVLDPAAYFGGLFSKPGSADHPQVYILGWTSDFPRTSDFIETQFRCGSPNNLAGYCDETLDDRIDATKALEATDPGTAIRAWTEIEHDLVDQAVWAPLGNRISNYPVSARTDNVQVHVQWGVLLSRIWVQ